MDKTAEEAMERWVAQLDPETLAGWLEDGEPDMVLPAEAVERIKGNTYHKLGIRPDRQKRWTRVWVALAASFLLVFMAVAAVGPEKAWAVLRDRLQFIPGLGVVLERGEDAGERYVLAEPVEQDAGSGRLRIKGIVADQERTILNITGTGLPEVREITIEARDGRSYPVTTYHIGSTTGYWEGIYVYPGRIANPTELTLLFTDKGNLRVSIELTQAQSFGSYSEMGPTAEVDDVSVTAVTSLEGGRLKINLLTPPLTGRRVTAYGVHLNAPPWESLIFTDTQGNRYSAAGAGSYTPPLRELYFDTRGSTDREFTLTIPAVTMVCEGKTTVTLDIPEEGSADLDQTVSLAGFPLHFYRAERVNQDEVRFYLDTGYRAEQAENLVSFALEGTRLPFHSYGMEWDEAMTGVIWLQFQIRPEMYRVKLYLEDAEVIKQGPWVLPVVRPAE